MYKSLNMILSVLALLCLAHSSAHAQEMGSSGSHGGTTITCDHTTLDPRFRNKTMLLDFADIMIHDELDAKMKLVESNESVDAQVERALQKITDQNIRNELQNEILKIRLRAKDTADTYWPLTQDIGRHQLPKPFESCKLRNSVNYFSDRDIEKNGALIQSLESNTQEAGLWVHEGVYKLARKYAQVTDAVAARRITAYLFSNYQNEFLINSLVVRYLMPKDKTTSLINLPTSLTPKKEWNVTLIRKADFEVMSGNASYSFIYEVHKNNTLLLEGTFLFQSAKRYAKHPAPPIEFLLSPCDRLIFKAKYIGALSEPTQHYVWTLSMNIDEEVMPLRLESTHNKVDIHKQAIQRNYVFIFTLDVSDYLKGRLSSYQ